MANTRQWLESLGFDQYADAFELNDIDWSLVPELTNDFLKDIGVESTGHRMLILRAAAEAASAIPGQATEEARAGN